MNLKVFNSKSWFLIYLLSLEPTYIKLVSNYAIIMRIVRAIKPSY